MEVLAYEGPDGELLLRPSMETLAPFFTMDSDYWLGGSGSAYIGWIKLRNPGYTTLFERPVLHIFVHEPYGICLNYEIVSSQASASSISLMSCDEAAPKDLLVEHYIGGEAAYLPRRCFVTGAVAERAVAAFLHTAQPLPEMMWRPRRNQQYDGYAYANAPIGS